MQYRRLGRSGAKVSVLAMGTDNFVNPTDEAESIAMVLAALDNGVNFIDTSNSYAAGRAEAIIGKALADGRRNEAFIATKVHYPTGTGPNDRGNSRLHIMRACEESLRRLGTDYVDLYQLHRPDFETPHEETLSALSDLVTQGKIRYIGSSTAPAWRILEGILLSEMRGWPSFVSEQPPYNLLDRRIENETVPMALSHGVGIVPWSPLAMGVLGGRYLDSSEADGQQTSAGLLRPADSRASVRGGIYGERVSDQAINVGNEFVRMARASGYDAAQLAICWVKDQPGVTAPIIGPKSVDQLLHFLPVADMTLSEEMRAACDLICPPGSAVANFHNSAPWMKMNIVPRQELTAS